MTVCAIRGSAGKARVEILFAKRYSLPRRRIMATVITPARFDTAALAWLGLSRERAVAAIKDSCPGNDEMTLSGLASIAPSL